MTPGSCSTGIHILLEELELLFEVSIVNLLAGDQYKSDYLGINPKGSIPTLVSSEGKVITEFSAIAWWLARNYPKAKLLPERFEDEVSVLEAMNYAVSTVHMQGFTRIFTPENYLFNTEDEQRVKAQGEVIVKKGFAVMEKTLQNNPYLVKHFSIADTALFYCEFWANRTGIELPPACQQHFERMLQRRAVKQVLIEEGYHSLYG